jgi:hypothetical protein
MSEPRTFDVQIVRRDGTIGAGKYTSPDGQLPSVGQVIPVDEHGNRGRVTEVDAETELIRAEPID